MAQVVREECEPNGLPAMIAGLIEANLRADPARERLLESARGAVQVDATDAVQTVGLKFVPGTLTVTSSPLPGADLRISADAATLMALATAPLRFGLPDPLSAEGRAVTVNLMRGTLRVRGLPLGLPMMARLNRLLSIGRGEIARDTWKYAN